MKYGCFYSVWFFMCTSFVIGAAERDLACKVAVINKMPWFMKGKNSAKDPFLSIRAVNPQFSQVVASKKDGDMVVYSFTTGKEVFLDKGLLQKVSFSSDGSQICAIKGDENLVIYDSSSGSKLSSFSNEGDITSFTWINNDFEKMVSVGTKNGDIFFTKEGSLTSINPFGYVPIDVLASSANGEKLAAISKKTKKVLIYNLSDSDDGKVILLDVYPSKIAFVKEGASLLVASNDEGITSFNSNSFDGQINYNKGIEDICGKRSFFSKVLFSGYNPIRELQSSPGRGERFLVGFHNGLITINDSETGDTLTSFDSGYGSGTDRLDAPLSFSMFHVDGSHIFTTDRKAFGVWANGTEYIKGTLGKDIENCTLQEVERRSKKAFSSKMIASFNPLNWNPETRVLGYIVGGAGIFTAIVAGGETLRDTIRTIGMLGFVP